MCLVGHVFSPFCAQMLVHTMAHTLGLCGSVYAQFLTLSRGRAPNSEKKIASPKNKTAPCRVDRMGAEKRTEHMTDQTSHTSVPHYQSLLLRGGRMTKVAGQAASYAPSLGKGVAGLVCSASAISIGVVLIFGSATSAFGGICSETAPGSGIFSCSGPADPVNDTEQSLSVNFGTDLVVSTEDGFGIDATTAGDNGLRLLSASQSGTSAGSAGGDIVFTDDFASDISGSNDGINAESAGPGDLTITTNGTVVGVQGDGIDARASYDSTNTTISVNNVTGARNGINAYGLGSGTLQVTASGSVTGTNSDGIIARSNGGSEDGFRGADIIILDVNDVTGGDSGIDARHFGNGDMSITSSGTVTGQGDDGIKAYNSRYSESLTISANDVEGANRGIYARNDGTDLTISANNVTGGVSGVQARNNGSGALSVTTTGQITANRYDGISAQNGNSGTDLTVNAASVTANGFYGIYAGNNGSGALSVTASGPVTGGGDGIFARNASDGTDLTINAADTTGGKYGIRANNSGTGALSITSTGQATGIIATNSPNGTSLTIDAASATGDKYGVFAVNNGSAALSITTTGPATGDKYGISGFNSDDGTDLTINAADATGGKYGIIATNNGTGALSITSTGSVVGGTNGGLRASNGAAGTDLTIDVVDVTAQDSGNAIVAVNNGTGALSVTATGDVTAANVERTFGINAINNSAGTDLTVAAANVTASKYGVVASNSGTGALSITTTGVVTTSGLGRDTASAIEAANTTNGTDVTVSVADVYSGLSGVLVTGSGSGAVSITASGTITTETGIGVSATVDNAGTDLMISVNNITASRGGIQFRQRGSGTASVTATGTVDGGTSNGIQAFVLPATDTVVDVNTVRGDRNGIVLSDQTLGDITVIASGPVTGVTENGIDIRNGNIETPTGGSGADIIIDVADVTGGDTGILTSLAFEGTQSVTVAGAVTGGTGDGITLVASEDVTNLVTLNDGAAVSGGSGFAIDDRAGDTTVIANAGSALANSVNLRGGTDTLNLAGGTVAAGAVMDGGEGDADSLVISGQGYILDSTALINWEDVTIDGGSVAFSDGTAPSAGASPLRIINAGVLNANAAFVLDDDLVTATGGSFSGTGGGAGVYAINGDVTNGGVLTTQDGSAGDVITINGTYTGGGVVQLDTVLGDDASATDLLAVTGDTAGTSTLNVANAGGGGDITTLGIEVITVDGTSAGDFALDGDFVTANGNQAIVAGAFAYTLTQTADGNWALVSEDVPVVDPGEDGDGDGNGGEDGDGGDVGGGGAGGGDVDGGGDGGDGGIGGEGDGGDPLFQPSAPIYESFAQTLLSLNTLPTKDARVGDRNPTGATFGKATVPGLGEVLNSPFWVQFEGSNARLAPLESTTDAESETDIFKLRGGLDYTLGTVGQGELVGGVSLHYGTAQSEVSSPAGDGDIETTGYGIGLSATWYGNNDVYVDGQLQYSVYESDLTSDVLGALISGNDGSGTAASLEVGRTYALDGGLSVTPQAQLTYSTVDFDSFTGPNDERVSLDEAESLKLRLGVAADYTVATPFGDQNLYGIVNVTREFADAPRVDVSGVTLTQAVEDWSAEIGVGGRYAFDENTTLQGDIRYSTGLENVNDSRTVSASLSIRMEF